MVWKRTCNGDTIRYTYDYMNRLVERRYPDGSTVSFTYTPTGKRQTLFEGGGNDFDLASVLIALLRVSGIHARYVRGQVIIPIERAMKWLKCVKERELVGRILATTGIPGVYIQGGGQIVAVKIDHVWVEAYVDYIPSRGAVHKQGDTWIPLDPSFKEYSYVQGIDISQVVVFNEDEYLDTLRQESPLDFYLDQIRGYFEENYPDTTFFAGVSGAVIAREYLGLLPAKLPYEVENKETFAEIADTDRHRIEFTFRNRFGEVTLSHSVSTPEIAGEGVSLFFKPATPYDEQLIEEYGGLYNVPAYLLTLKPSLRIGGDEVADGDDIGFGENCAFSLKFQNPSGFTDYTDHAMIAGGWYGIALNLQKIPGDVMTKVSDTLIPILEQMDLSDTLAPVVIEPEWAELALTEFGLGYFSMLDASEQIFAGFNDIVLTKYISECLTAFNVSVEYLYGMPYRVDQTGVLMDAAKVILNPFSRDMRSVNQRHFQILTGFDGSYWEHNLFELWMRMPSVSAVKALEIAHVESIPVYLINSENLNEILPLLELPDELKQEITNSVNSGLEVKAPKKEIQFIDWEGTGYIIRDPETGTGAYKISGGYAGGGSGEEGPVIVGRLASFLSLLINVAVASQCDSKTPTGDFENVCNLVMSMYTIHMFFRLGYFPEFYSLESKETFYKAIGSPYLRIFQYLGHGKDSVKISDSLYIGLYITHDSSGKPIYITKFDIEDHIHPEAHIIFVYLGACHTADKEHELGRAFGAEAVIDWEKEPSIGACEMYAYDFWTITRLFLVPAGSVYQMLSLLPLFTHAQFWGNPFVYLQRIP